MTAEIKKQLANWMSYIPDDTNLTALSIPGTHDSHSSKQNYPNLGADQIRDALRKVPDFKSLMDTPLASAVTSIAQNLSVTQYDEIHTQLEYGVRFLDVRVGNPDFRLRNRFVPLQGHLDLVVLQVNRFLKEHPKEVVIVSIVWDHEGESPAVHLARRVRQIWDDNKWYTGRTWPSLGQVRGKAVLFRRFDPEFDPHNGFGINGEEFFNSRSCVAVNGGWSLQDVPKDNQGLSQDSRWDHGRSHLDIARDISMTHKLMYITGFYDVKYSPLAQLTTPAQYADEQRKRLKSYLASVDINPATSRFGLIILDFMTLEQSLLIISKNWKQSVYSEQKLWTQGATLASFDNGVNIVLQADGHIVVYRGSNPSNRQPIWAFDSMWGDGKYEFKFEASKSMVRISKNGAVQWSTPQKNSVVGWMPTLALNGNLRFMSGPPYLMIDTKSGSQGTIEGGTIIWSPLDYS